MDNYKSDGYDKKFLKLFWRKVIVLGKEECWEWQASTQSKGYGCISVNGKIKLAHRVAYKIINGEIPEGKMVLHKCDNRLCVNPNHLYLGDHLDNMRDMKERGRQAQGEKNGRSKLSWKEVKDIRNIYITNQMSYRKIGEQFGISSVYVGSLVKGAYWKLPLAK